MEDAPTRTLQGSSATVESVEIDEELEAAFNALPPPSKFGYGIPWTPQMETLLLKYWRIRDQAGVAELLGVSRSTAKRKYRDLVGGRRGN